MKSRLTKLLFYCMLLFIGTKAHAQLSITGPSCVIAGREYQYLIEGDWSDDSTMQVCVQGGVLLNGDSLCKIGSFGDIHVVWDSSSTTHSLQLSSAGGNSTFEVILTTELKGGWIDSAITIQTVAKDSVPATIFCSHPTGGNCSPVYSFVWQQSSDGLHWSDIPTLTTPNLSFAASLSQTTYYRRKATEIISRSVEYSNVVIIAVIPVSEEP